MANILVFTSTFPGQRGDATPPFVWELSSRLGETDRVRVLTPYRKGALHTETWDTVEIIRFRYGFGPMHQLTSGQGIMSELRARPWLWLVVPFFLLAQSIALLTQIWRWKPDVIHAHWIIPQGGVTWLVTRLWQVPYVVTVHGGDLHQFQRRLMRSLKHRVLRQSARVTTVSASLGEELHTRFPDLGDVSILPMGISVETFANGSPDERLREHVLSGNGLLLLFVGRLVPKKGAAYVLEAVKRLIENGKSVHLIVLGMGSEYGRLQRLTQEYGISGAVTFWGEVEHKTLPDWYATADICLLPALRSKDGDREGWGLSLIEAIAAGCIPVGSEETCLSEIVPPEYASLLISEVEGYALQRHVTELRERKEEWPQIRNALQNEVKASYSWKHVVTQYRTILRDAL